MSKRNRTRTVVIVVLALGAMFSGFLISQHHARKNIDMSQFHGTYLQHPRPVNDFSLTGIDHQVFNNSSLQGHWTLVFFGFTHCAYLCPTTMAELAKMYRVLEEKKVQDLPQVVMISIDPERDGLDHLANYVHSFQPAFYGASGSEAALQAMTREMGVAYAKVNDQEKKAQNYDIQHSGAIILFNPQGELNAFFTTPHHAAVMAKDYILLVS